MKRTTYIFIGILVSVLVILMAGVVYISFQKSETNSYTLTLSEKILRTEFPVSVLSKCMQTTRVVCGWTKLV